MLGCERHVTACDAMCTGICAGGAGAGGQLDALHAALHRVGVPRVIPRLRRVPEPVHPQRAILHTRPRRRPAGRLLWQGHRAGSNPIRAIFLTIFIFASFNARWALQHGCNANLNCLHANFCLIFCSCNQFFCLNLMTKGKLWIELQKCQSNAHALLVFCH